MYADAVENYRVWARIEHVAPGEFVVIVRAAPESADPAGVRKLTETCSSYGAAKAALSALMVKIGKAVSIAEGRVVNTEVDGL